MNSFWKIFYVTLRLFLGIVMIKGGIEKFEKPIPSPIEVLEKAEKFKDPSKEETLQKILYISGSKQTDYFWQLLGVCELLFGFLLVIQGSSFIGAVFLLPITLHIFLFHLFLERDATGELLFTAGLLIANILLVLKDRKVWHSLLWVHPWKD